MDQIRNLEEAVEAFCIFIESDPQQVVIPIKHGVKPYTLAKLLPDVAGHIRNHQSPLRKGLRKQEGI